MPAGQNDEKTVVLLHLDEVEGSTTFVNVGEGATDPADPVIEHEDRRDNPHEVPVDAYTPAVGADWEDVDPTGKTEALDRIAGGHAGVAYVNTTAPTDPGIGQVWLDIDADPAGLNVVEIDDDTILTPANDIVLVDASSGVVTVTLPVAAQGSTKIFRIKKIDASANAVTIDGDGSETIDESTTRVLSSQYDSVTIVTDQAEWWIL